MSKPSLKDWVVEHGTPKRPQGFIDKLPAEIRDQIRASADDDSISTRDVVAWLQSIGFPEATVHPVARFRTDVKHGRV